MSCFQLQLHTWDFKYATNSNEMGDEEKNWKKLIHALESLLVCLKEILKVKNGKTKIDIRSNIESFAADEATSEMIVTLPWCQH